MIKTSIEDYISLGNVTQGALITFLSHIFDFLSDSKESIDLITFHNYMNFPFTISEKLFSSFTKRNTKPLSRKTFSKKIANLYNGSVIKRTKILFRFLDVDGDGIIHLEDVKFLLNYFHSLHQMKNKNEMKEIINALFNKVDYITEFEFYLFLSKVSSDIYYLVFYFFLRNIPFTPSEVNFFSKLKGVNLQYVLSTKTTSSSSDSEFEQLLPPSGHIESYFDLESEIASEEDLNELNLFEDEIGKLKCGLGQARKEQSCDAIINLQTPFNMSMKKNSKDEEEIEWGKQKRIVTVNQLDSDKRIVHEGDDSPYAYLKPLKFQESDNNLPICNGLSSFFKVNKDIFTNSDVDCFLFIKEPKTEIIPVKFQICKNTLFVLKKNKFDSVILLKGKTFIMTNSQKVVIFKEQVYYSFTFQFQYCVGGTELSVLFKEVKVFKAFIAKIKNILGTKSPNDTYRIIKDLSKNNKTVIKLCENKLTKEMVAIKFAKKSQYNTKESAMLLLQEIEVSKYLSKLLSKYPIYANAIVNFVDFFESQNYWYIVSLYLPSQPLSSYLSKIDELNLSGGFYSNNRYYLPFEFTTQIINQLIATVKFLHRKGIAHRNLSPDNLMINIDKENKQIITTLIGFNQAKIFLPFEKTKQSVISSNFSSPEIARCHLHDKKTDIWTIGALTYYLLYKDFIVNMRDLADQKVNSFNRIDQGEEEKNSDTKIKNELSDCGLWKIIKSFVNFNEEKRPDLKLYHL